jgi:hypothetical protein
MRLFTLLKIGLTGQPLFKMDSYVSTKTTNGHEIAFTNVGFTQGGPAIVTFSGWDQGHRGLANVTPYST